MPTTPNHPQKQQQPDKKTSEQPRRDTKPDDNRKQEPGKQAPSQKPDNNRM